MSISCRMLAYPRLDMNKCIKCGFCCTVSCCPYGTWNARQQRCWFLTEDNLCAKYDEIIQDPGQGFSPAFGSGCSSSLFNPVRERRIEREEL